MKRLALVSARSAPVPCARAQNVPPHVDALLKQIKAADKDQLAVSEEDGRFMRLLVVTSGAKRALEIGAASGYSAIWIGLGMRETGGKLVTIEYDKARAQQAAANIKKAGLSDVVQVISGDAFAEIPKVPGTFDFVFCDAWKRDYQKFFSMVFPAHGQGRAVSRPQRHQQARRDGRLPQDHPHQPGGADVDCRAIGRGRVDYFEEVARTGPIRQRMTTPASPLVLVVEDDHGVRRPSRNSCRCTTSRW